jgi:hypothetical protein
MSMVVIAEFDILVDLLVMGVVDSFCGYASSRER